MGVSAIDEEMTPLERVTAGAVVGLTLWIAVNWILALSHILTRLTLSIAAVAFVGAAVFLLWRRLRFPRFDPWTIAVLVPIAIWICYVLWRGVILPPDNHDALAYHLPKAALIAQTHGYDYFVTGDPRFEVNRQPDAVFRRIEHKVLILQRHAVEMPPR